MEDQASRNYEIEKEDKKYLSDSEEDVTDMNTPVINKHGKKMTSAGIVEDV